MRKRTIAALIAIAALAAVPALGGVAGAAPKTTVIVGNNFFSPAKKTVEEGTKVRFKWLGGRRHNVTKTKGPGGPIASRTTKEAGVNFAKRFGESGIYRFVCTIHPDEMQLKLIVG